MVGPILFLFSFDLFSQIMTSILINAFFSQICEGGWLAQICECLYVKVSFFFWGGRGGTPQLSIFLEHWATSPIEAPLWAASCPIGKCAPFCPPFQFIYMRVKL